MTPEEAVPLVDLLLEAHRPATSSWGARVLEYGRAERSGEPERIARALSELYAEATLSPVRVLSHTEDRCCSLVDAVARGDFRIRSLIDSGAVSGRSFTFTTSAAVHEWRGARDDEGALVLVTTPLEDD